MKKLYNAPRNNRAAFTAAGIIFEYRLQLFKEDGVIELFPIVPSDGGGNVTFKHYTTDTGVAGKRFTTPISKEIVFAGDPSIPLEVGIHCRPRGTTFPAIDSWLLPGPTPQDPAILLRFQITLDKDEHNVNQSGLIRVDKLVVADMEKYLVIITPPNFAP